MRERPLFAESPLPLKESSLFFFQVNHRRLAVRLTARLKPHAPGLTPRQALNKFSAMQMVDVHIPTHDEREVILTRYTQPERELQMLLEKLGMELPPQPPPRITPAQLLSGTDPRREATAV